MVAHASELSLPFSIVSGGLLSHQPIEIELVMTVEETSNADTRGGSGSDGELQLFPSSLSLPPRGLPWKMILKVRLRKAKKEKRPKARRDH